MKTEAEIETLLRKAPTPKAAPQLAAALKSAIKLPGHANGADLELSVPLWRRWFPALAYAVLILGCVVVLAVQSNQQQELIRQHEQLREEIAVAREAADAREQAQAKSQSAAREIEQLQHDAAEADRLAVRLAELQAQIVALNAQAKELEAQLAAVAPSTQMIEPYDFFGAHVFESGEPTKESAEKRCVNNLKQIGLAIRIWEANHGNVMPPDLNVMSNSLSTPLTLACPEDKASNDLAESLSGSGKDAWRNWPLNGGSYEFLTPGLETSFADPANTTVIRCRIHGYKIVGDGAVIHSATP